ncbi:MAG: WGR domain-containing protein [Gammaproteobacteria bacterium]
MSEWQVHLIFQDDTSNKFWRARCVGNALEVNFGRIGSDGQSQIKRYDSPDDSAKEMAKQAQAKRKKGYVDETGSATAAAPAPAPAATAPQPVAPAAEQCTLVLTLGDRKLELRMSVEGADLRTETVEHYASADAARAAYAAVRAALEADGYRPR